MEITQELLENWLDAKATLDAAKKEEADLRSQICLSLLEGKTEGTHNFSMFGYDLKAVKKLNYTLDANIDVALLTEEEQECIKFKPSLLMKNYKACVDTSILDEYISVKDGMPTLSIEQES